MGGDLPVNATDDNDGRRATIDGDGRRATM
jgi:hypothetical protein